MKTFFRWFGFGILVAISIGFIIFGIVGIKEEIESETFNLPAEELSKWESQYKGLSKPEMTTEQYNKIAETRKKLKLWDEQGLDEDSIEKQVAKIGAKEGWANPDIWNRDLAKFKKQRAIYRGEMTPKEYNTILKTNALLKRAKARGANSLNIVENYIESKYGSIEEYNRRARIVAEKEAGKPLTRKDYFWTYVFEDPVYKELSQEQQWYIAEKFGEGKSFFQEFGWLLLAVISLLIGTGLLFGCIGIMRTLEKEVSMREKLKGIMQKSVLLATAILIAWRCFVPITFYSRPPSNFVHSDKELALFFGVKIVKIMLNIIGMAVVGGVLFYILGGKKQGKG